MLLPPIHLCLWVVSIIKRYTNVFWHGGSSGEQQEVFDGQPFCRNDLVHILAAEWMAISWVNYLRYMNSLQMQDLLTDLLYNLARRGGSGASSQDL